MRADSGVGYLFPDLGFRIATGPQSSANQGSESSTPSAWVRCLRYFFQWEPAGTKQMALFFQVP